MSEERNNRPVEKLRENSLNADIFRNQHENGASFNTTFTRSYQDQEGQWREANSFRQSDLLSLQHLAGRAHDTIREMREQERQEQRAQAEQAQMQERTRERQRDRARDPDRGL